MKAKPEELDKVEKKDLFGSGHRACGGCGQALVLGGLADKPLHVVLPLSLRQVFA